MPAAGRATRLGLDGVSKELIGVPDLAASRSAGGANESPGAAPSVPVCHYLLRQYRAAGIDDVRLYRRAEKTDLGDYIARGPIEGLSITDVVIAPTPGSVHTLALGCAAAPGATIAIGFPDIVLEPETLCRDALAELERGGADLCLGTVGIPGEERANWDLVRTDGPRVIDYVMKPETTALERGCTLGVWRATVSAFLIDWLDDPDGAGRIAGEVSFGHFVQAVLAAGFRVHAAHAPAGTVLDIGVPERLARAARLGGDDVPGEG